MNDEPTEILFSDFIESFKGGRLDTQLTAALRDVVLSVTDHRKAGSVTLKITVKPGGSADQPHLLTFADDIVTSPAKPTADPVFMWADRTGQPHRDDPEQKPLPFTVHTNPNYEKDE